MDEKLEIVDKSKYPDVIVMEHGSKWGNLAVAGAIAIGGFGIAASFLFGNERDLSPTEEREAFCLEEMQSTEYELYAEPLENRPEAAGFLGKLTSPIVPVCKHESAALMVDSILAESYIKGLGQPAIGYVSQHEFPDIYIYGLPECSTKDVARINVPDALGKG